MSTFGELAFQPQTPGENIADEPTGPCFSPNKRVLFLNLQRANLSGVTIAIKGPFARPRRARGDRHAPMGARSAELRHLERERITLPDMSVGEVAAWTRLLRLRRVDEVPPGIEDLAGELGELERVPSPRRRLSRNA